MRTKGLAVVTIVVLVLSAAALFPCIDVAKAQAPGGSISGTITRESGGVIPGVRLLLTDQARTVTREATTGTDGLYNFPALPPAVYDVTISSPGFTTQVWTAITVGVGTDRVINIVMHPGDPQKLVRTTAPAASISQGSACCGGNVNSSTVRSTPLNGRDWAQLATLQAGVTGVQTGSATGGGNVDRGFGAPVSISGARPDQNSYRLDGISINDYANGAPGSVLGDNLGIDAVEQVSVLGSNYPADYGRTSGGVINAVTRSGTNAFHGDAYEFLRNSAVDARNFFDGAIPPFKRNQFGGSAGGPIQKDRTFIFGDYEGLRQSLGLTTVDTVPSPAARTGQLSTGAVAVDPAVGRFLKAFYPLPNGPLLGSGDTGIFTFAAQQVTSENYFTIRFDHKFSATDSFETTYMRDSSKTVQPDEFNELHSDIVSARQVITLHEQHSFGADALNAARFGFSRAVGIQGKVSNVLNAAMNDPSYGFVPGEFAGGVRAVPGVTDFTGAPTAEGFLSSSRSLAWNSFQGGDDFFLTHGIHAMSAGFVVERMQDNELSFANVNGVFRFDTLADFLTNQPRVFQGIQTGGLPDVGLRETLAGGYFEDDIRLRTNFIFNAGLRYEMVTVPTEAHNLISNLQHPSDAQPRVGAPFFHNPTLRNFEPRLGLAWNPRGGKTLVRSGFGIFDVLPLPYEFNLSFQRAYPFVHSIFANTLSPGSFPTGAYTSFVQKPGSELGTYVEQFPKRNYVMQWNLSVARELSSTLAMTVGYVGSRGVHLPYRVDNIDMVLPTLTPTGYVFPPAATSQTLNPNFGRIDATLWQANSFYHALQADLTKRVTRGVEFHVAYTWGKSIDTLSATEADDAFPNGLFNQLFFDQRTSRGLSDFNVAQTFVANFTWELPSPRSSSGFLNWPASGWQIGGVYKASTGQPFTPILGGDPAGQKLDETSQPPSLLGGSGCATLTNPGNPNTYIKTQCLAFPGAGHWGNLGRNSLIGPGVSNLDFSVFKNNPVKRISENFNVQFRAEFFNILNRANFASPTQNLAVFDQIGVLIPSAGLITATQTTSRQIQFALKMLW
ncbi:MAG TPA: carboxypeptidase regulatory-like domain-containing protein [Candidatus Acidoferrales bacterium]|nr:carboxypeptidase regulatory-like domain-containing protein [Candidatus Acidoferrales bacterium]